MLNFFSSRVFRYFLAAGIATMVDICVYYIMFHYVLSSQVYDLSPSIAVSSPSISLIVSYTCGLFTNFLISKYFVFGESKVIVHVQFLRFAGVALLVLFLNYCLMSFLIHRLHWFPTVSRAFSALSLGVVSYSFHKIFTFMVTKKSEKRFAGSQKTT